jgi:hypothetical protein
MNTKNTKVLIEKYPSTVEGMPIAINGCDYNENKEL